MSTLTAEPQRNLADTQLPQSMSEPYPPTRHAILPAITTCGHAPTSSVLPPPPPHTPSLRMYPLLSTSLRRITALSYRLAGHSAHLFESGQPRHWRAAAGVVRRSNANPRLHRAAAGRAEPSLAEPVSASREIRADRWHQLTRSACGQRPANPECRTTQMTSHSTAVT